MEFNLIKTLVIIVLVLPLVIPMLWKVFLLIAMAEPSASSTRSKRTTRGTYHCRTETPKPKIKAKRTDHKAVLRQLKELRVDIYRVNGQMCAFLSLKGLKTFASQFPEYGYVRHREMWFLTNTELTTEQKRVFRAGLRLAEKKCSPEFYYAE